MHGKNGVVPTRKTLKEANNIKYKVVLDEFFSGNNIMYIKDIEIYVYLIVLVYTFTAR